MSEHSKHSGSHSHEHGHTHEHGKKRPIHRDWRLWAGVVLALVGMAVYVLSDNEALQPGGQNEPPMEAAP